MKVHPFEIPKSVGDSIIVQVDSSRAFFKYFHQHKEIQISQIVQGQGKLIVANSVHGFVDGDVFVIGENTPHLFQSAENSVRSHMISVFFRKDSFSDGFSEITELSELRQFLDSTENSFGLISEKECIKKIISDLKEMAGLDKFIHFLKLIKKINAAKTAPLTSRFQPKIVSNEEGQRIQIVFDYVINNFRNEIRLNEVATLIHMTPNAFCRFFRQRTNKTFFEFVIELRIEHACQLISSMEEFSIAEIADKSGFTSISNFNRKFKKLKKATPTSYRNNIKTTIPY